MNADPDLGGKINADPDLGGKFYADPCGSGSTDLHRGISLAGYLPRQTRLRNISSWLPAQVDQVEEYLQLVTVPAQVDQVEEYLQLVTCPGRLG